MCFCSASHPLMFQKNDCRGRHRGKGGGGTGQLAGGLVLLLTYLNTLTYLPYYSLGQALRL